MGHLRLKLLAMAVASVLVLDCAIAASKGASRSGGHRRTSTPTSSHSRRSHKEREEDWESPECEVSAGTVGKVTRRPTRGKNDKKVQREGSTSRRKHAYPSSSSASRSGPRKVEASESGSRERRRNRAHGMELVPSRRGQPKPSMLAGIAATVKGRAAAMQEDAKGKMTEWRNIAKTTVWFSSKMEKFMIQMTWPDDGVLDDIWVKDTMNFLESAGNEPPRSPNNPNKRILRKLWLRMTEQDYRTKLKALQILHHTSIDLSPEALTRVRNQFLKMRDETNHKNRNEVYFEPSRIMDVSSSGMPFLPLLRSYSSFAFRRVTEVQGGPQQLASSLRSKKTSQADAVSLLRRLDKLICTGTRCKVDRKTLNTITGQVVNLAARDMMSLWRLYVKGLKRMMKGGYKDGKMATPEEVSQLLKQYSKTQDMVQAYLVYHKKIVRDRAMFDDNQIDSTALEDFLSIVATEDFVAEGDKVAAEEDGSGEEEGRYGEY